MTAVAFSPSTIADSYEERRSTGRALRREIPRSAHAEWSPSVNRCDPIAILEAQAATRVPELVPIRYARMAESPFAFFRGAAAVMAADLAETPWTGLTVQACGDGHISNFGKFATPERNVIFDVNDFDETLPGPWEWDVKRLCASLWIAARDRGSSVAECEAIVLAAARSYRERIREASELHTMELWYDRIHIKDVISHFPPKYQGIVRADIKRARRKDHRRAVEKLTTSADGAARFVDDPPLVVHFRSTRTTAEDVEAMIRSYRESLTEDRKSLFDRFEVVDVARKVVGVGSVGTRCWIVLLQGPTRDDRLVLQVKQAEASVLEKHVGASSLGHHGLRVVVGQRLTQAASDVFLGWCDAPGSGNQYYVRQLWDVKGQGDITKMPLGKLPYYGALCALTLARAHARTGDAVPIGAYLGKGDRFDRSMATFAARYAETNELDHARLLEAIRTGRIASRSA
jgi:uncharacterized protein (DUF2252 family)